MAISVGDDAPDFTLKDQGGNEISLSSFRGEQNVVLVFYPFTFSGICTDELCELRDDPSTFATAGAQLIAVSCNARHAQAAWAEREGYDFPVLTDFWPHGEVAKAYGVFNDALGCANRATFVIDKDGKVAATFATADLTTPRQRADYEAALATLG
ncbi:MAG: peroxiredoxin [Acidimicrobiia bacterium]